MSHHALTKISEMLPKQLHLSVSDLCREKRRNQFAQSIYHSCYTCKNCKHRHNMYSFPKYLSCFCFLHIYTSRSKKCYSHLLLKSAGLREREFPEQTVLPHHFLMKIAGIPKTEKAIFFLHRLLIGMQDIVPTCKCGYQHHQS